MTAAQAAVEQAHLNGLARYFRERLQAEDVYCRSAQY